MTPVNGSTEQHRQKAQHVERGVPEVAVDRPHGARVAAVAKDVPDGRGSGRGPRHRSPGRGSRLASGSERRGHRGPGCRIRPARPAPRQGPHRRRGAIRSAFCPCYPAPAGLFGRPILTRPAPARQAEVPRPAPVPAVCPPRLTACGKCASLKSLFWRPIPDGLREPGSGEHRTSYQVRAFGLVSALRTHEGKNEKDFFRNNRAGRNRRCCFRPGPGRGFDRYRRNGYLQPGQL